MIRIRLERMKLREELMEAKTAFETAERKLQEFNALNPEEFPRSTKP